MKGRTDISSVSCHGPENSKDVIAQDIYNIL